MLPLQRSAARSTQRLRPHVQRRCRRNASNSHGSHESHEAQTESFGRGFFISLAVLPASIAIYQYTSRGAEQPYFTRLIGDTYDEYKTKWAQRNDLHTQMIEQAAADRVLFLNESARPLPNLRFPEQFNTGSPWNVPAGHGRVNIDQVINKYEKEGYERQEEKLRQLRENDVPREKSVEPLVRRAPGPSN